MSTTSPSVVYAGRLIDGKFPLLRPLGETESSSVFLTEFGDEPKQKATIKLIQAGAVDLIQAGAVDAEACVARWERAKTLSHPHLIKLLHHGRAELDGRDLLYVVSEYADEVLSEILPERALTPEETREMLDPVLDALSFLHAQNLVHGQLKPSNILVVDDRLKLSADGIAAAGETATRSPLPYDAPEIGTAKMSPAADLWSLGVVLVQAMTQQPPAWNRDSGTEPEVPASIPEPFFGIARECLRLDPAGRLALSGLNARLNSAEAGPAQTAPVVPVDEGTSAPLSEPAAEKDSVQPAESAGKKNLVQPAAPAAEKLSGPLPVPASESPTKPTFKSNVQAVIGTLVVICVALFVMRAGSRHKAPSPQPSSAAPSVAQPPPQAPAARTPSAPIVKGEVASRVLPDIPEKIAGAVRGHIKVAIRVQVDSQGNVVQASIDTAGSSHYFADQALHAAQQWKFTPAWIGGRTVPSTWLLHFQFGQNHAEANAQEETP